MREYVKSNKIKVTPAQLDLLVPAFDLAWGVVQVRLRPHHNLEEVRQRVAATVVDLVIADGMTSTAKVIRATIDRMGLGDNNPLHDQ